MNKIVYSQGASILELIISMAISIPILMSVASAFTNQSHIFYNLNEKIKYFETLAVVGKMAEQVMQDTDSHPFMIPPRIQKAPYIYLYDNNTRLNKTALEGTSIITSMQTSMANLLNLEDQVITGTRISGRACKADLTNSINLSDTKHVLAIHHEFTSEVLSTFTRDYSQVGCFRVVLTPVNGMLTNIISKEQLKLVKQILPIEWIRTYYIAPDSIFRVLQHRGTEIVLNQPILNSCLPYQASLITNHIKDHLALEIRFSDDKYYNSRIFIQQNIPRISNLNFVANL